MARRARRLRGLRSVRVSAPHRDRALWTLRAVRPGGRGAGIGRIRAGDPGVFRVRGGDDLGGPLPVMYRLAAAGDTAALLRAVSDTGLAVLGLGAGRYELRALAIAHRPLTATFDFGPDTGAVATLRLERGAVSLCEDGIRARRLPWWRIW